jgi:hypothetical protein
MAIRRKSDDLLSLQVILQPASGKLRADMTLEAMLPAPADAERALAWFAQEGFACGPLVANSFSISAVRSVCAACFGKAALHAAEADHSEVVLDQLPAGMRKVLAAISFTPPPDFGPLGNY